jgi:tetratricopeptide (TPR) repeat protein
MTRDNLLFATIGVLAGFISGYFVHEVMALRQPPPLAVLQAAQAAAAGGSPHGPGGAVPLPDGAAAPGAGGEPAAAEGAAMADINRLKAQLEQNPDDAEATLQLANLNYDIRNWQRARELYVRYLELKPPHPDVLTDLGVACRGLGQFQEALGYFEQAQQLQSGHWQSLFNQVVVLAFDLREQGRAQEVLQRLRALQPDNPEVARLAQEVEKAFAAGTA